MKNIFQSLFVCMMTVFLMMTSLASYAVQSPYSADSVLAFKRIGEVVVSPNGRQVALTTFVVKKYASGLKWECSLFLKDRITDKMQLLVKADHISNVNWSPDGNALAYLTKNKTLWTHHLVLRATKKLTEFNGEILSLKWSPTGNFIAFSGNEKKKKSLALTPIDVDKDYTNARLYLIPVNGGVSPVALTSADYSVSQHFSPGFDWSPDGKSIVFSHMPRAGAAYEQENKISVINIKTAVIKNLPYTEKQTGVQPAYSPDGKWIAFKSNLPFSEKATNLTNDIQLFGRICISSTATFETRCLENTPNQSPSLIGWNKSSDQVYVLDSEKTEGPKIYAISLTPSIATKRISDMEGFIEPATLSLNNSRTYFGFGYETVSQAPEVYVSAVNPFKIEQISRLQSPRHNVPLGSSNVIHWRSTDGMDIEGLLVTPANYDAKKHYPLYVAVHGGPSGAWWKRYLGGCDEYGGTMDISACWANLLSEGFVILQPNPRGSSGYGMAFSVANFGDLGGGDYHDIMSGVDYVIQKGIADPDHLAIGGWSFGGYMTAWTISQNNRFKAAIDGDGNTNFISFSGTSDIPHYYINYLGSAFWENDALYVKRAPISYVKNISTPLLMIEGERDVRVPPGQSYELYTALKMQNKPVKMLLLPGQGHVPSDPNIIRAGIQEIDEWLRQAL